MNDTEPIPESTHPDEGATSEGPTMVSTPPASTLAASREGVDELPFDEIAEEDDEWLSTGPARGIRLAVPAAALLAVVFVAAGFWGGVTLEKNHAGSSGSAAAGFAGRTRAGGAGGGFGFGGAGPSAASAGTTGTISVVNGTTLYILSSTGALVKVTLSKSTTITRNADTTPAGLRPGDTVTVQGATSANGNLAATSISTTAPGVSSSTGGGFGGGGAAGGTSTTAGTTTSSGG
ncbi:MAG TPA: DUF5666 domain-containing protein [Acidimicrobiales bacterium]|nr:DUF5666 domain-containing protein [Acidimicrobiales bacterium]